MAYAGKLCLVLHVFLLQAISGHSTLWTEDRTNGEIWPKPRFVNYKKISFTMYLSEFSFKVTNQTCDILQEAIKRYTDMMEKMAASRGDSECVSSHNVTTLSVELGSPCQQWPQANMKENYELHVNGDSAVLKSDSIWGILRGMESFSQIVVPSTQLGCLVVNHTDILDYPRFPHRGLLLDTSRHYLPVKVILTIISAMEMNKMNVFHWHIVDDESFPYQSITFPGLSERGAYNPKKAIYSQEDVKLIVEQARLRGIRVLPEFDTPGHTQSWGKGTSKLLTPCYSEGKFNGKFGPVDPSRPENFKFMASLLKEVKDVFPDNYIHLGGDEVNPSCWETNPAIQKFMKEKSIKTSDELEGYYIKEVLNILNNIGAKGIVWQEVFQNHVELEKDTIVHVWKSGGSAVLEQVTRKGLQALASEYWYLDVDLNENWDYFYKADPTDFNGTHSQKELVLGGEACMWGEMVDETNVVPRIWPRASGAAERFWSSAKENNTKEAVLRLNEHVCRMKRRGVAAQPAAGAGYCSY